jgi:cbb3-type cytochrome oxidase maturation protein
MSVILILILASLTLAGAFLACFIWAVRSGQFDDTFTPSMRMLTDEEKLQTSNFKAQNRSLASAGAVSNIDLTQDRKT